ncbi:transcriptional activator ramA [Enterobacter hormaechei]|nr:transcriptional activator ramA [Enterobacter hormaechei]
MFRTEDIIDEITQWIDSNLHKPLKIEDVAARAGYSKWHLQRIFVQVKEVSLGKYIRDTKLRLAAKILLILMNQLWRSLISMDTIPNRHL